MKILDFSDKKLIALGDIHHEFNQLGNAIKIFLNNQRKRKKRGELEKQKNIVFIVCGDCGFGFNKLEYYKQNLKKLNELLKEHDSFLLFVRGNHDNPKYFNTNEFELGFENIILVPDYSVVKTKTNTTLCIGGAISHDRAWRIEEQKRRKRFKTNSERDIYWIEENVHPNDDMLSNLTKEGIIVNSIITHTAPLMKLIPNNDELKNEFSTLWVDGDEKLLEEIDKENELLESIYKDLISNGHDIKWWCCGHYHMGRTYQIENSKTKMIVLNIFKNYNINFDRVSQTVQRGFASDLEIKEKKDSLEDIKEMLENINLEELYVNYNSSKSTVRFNTNQRIVEDEPVMFGEGLVEDDIAEDD